MRIGFNFVNGLFDTSLDDFLTFSAQYGATDVVIQSSTDKESAGRWSAVPGEKRWELNDLVKLRTQVESHGLHLEALENVPSTFYDQVMLGGPDREEQIENMIYTVRNIARAGIPIFGYNWMPSSVWRTSNHTPNRGGSTVTSYDHSQHASAPFTHGREFSKEEMWANLEDWIKIITPVAEEEGIRLGIHPADPPVDSVGGIPRLLTGFDAYKRLIEIVDSPSNAIEFCQGTFSEMPDDDIYEMIEYFASRNKVLYVHFRHGSAKAPKFNEEFINTGYVDMKRAMRTYRDAGYEGTFIDDHCPIMLDDATFPGNLGGYRSRLFAQGYIQGLIESVEKEVAYGGPLK